MKECMSQYRRMKSQGGTYFFTVATHRRLPMLTGENVRQALREGILRARQTLPFSIEAWVLLPDHLHTIWTLPAGDANFSARWAIIKRHVSKMWGLMGKDPGLPNASRVQRKESTFWQRRFWEHYIRDDEDFHRHFDYIHWNPVKHGYVLKVSDWPYSTFHRFVAQGIYPEYWGGISEGESKCHYGE